MIYSLTTATTFNSISSATTQIWLLRMDTEYASISQNETWDLQTLSADKRAITAQWIYKVRPASLAQPPRYKARLVARGFQQRHGTDYGETFAPSVKYETISTIAAHHIWPIRHLNVQTSFLNGVLQEKVYMQQHLGFVVVGREREVCRLKRMLYDLRQSPHACYHRIDLALCAKGLQRNNADSNLYIARLDGKILLLILYVNDIYLTRTNSPLFSDLATSIKYKSLPWQILVWFLNISVFILLAINVVCSFIKRHIHYQSWKNSPSLSVGPNSYRSTKACSSIKKLAYFLLTWYCTSESLENCVIRRARASISPLPQTRKAAIYMKFKSFTWWSHY